MKRLFILSIFLFLIFPCSTARGEDILGAGDSIMMGWPDAVSTAALPALAEQLGGAAWFNAGIDGSNISDMYSGLPALLSAHHPSRVYSHIGSNDSRYEKSSLSAFLSTYDDVKTAVKNAGAVLYVGLITPVSRCCGGSLGRTARGQQTEKLWNAALEDWCFVNRVNCYASYQDLAMNNPAHEDDLQYNASLADGIHISSVGYNVLSNLMYHAAVPFRGRIWGSPNYPRMGYESWKWWIITGKGSVTGDGDTGTFRLSKNASASSNVLAIVAGNKHFTIVPVSFQGGVSVFYRTDRTNFARNALYQSWKIYTGSFDTTDQFIQIRISNSKTAEALIDEVKLSWAPVKP